MNTFLKQTNRTKPTIRRLTLKPLRFVIALVAALAAAPYAIAQSSGTGEAAQRAELAKKLSNPVANLISVPFKLDYNQGYADGDGDQYQLNIEPVIPFSISEDWNVISRTVLPIISQDGVIPTEGSQFGLGSTTQSFFFSPKAPTKAGLIWGAGPAFLLPTATDHVTSDQWGAGVTAVGLVQKDHWTVGVLANQIWSISGNTTDGDISAAFLQPFLSYTTPKATSFTLDTESTYNWESGEWAVPINAVVAQVVKIGSHHVQFGLGARYWAQSPEDGPEGWGARLQATLLFPK